MYEADFDLHQSKPRSDTFPGTFAKRKMCHWMTILLVLVAKSFGVEFVRFREDFWVMLNPIKWDKHQSVLLDHQLCIGDFVVV